MILPDSLANLILCLAILKSADCSKQTPCRHSERSGYRTGLSLLPLSIQRDKMKVFRRLIAAETPVMPLCHIVRITCVHKAGN